MKKLISVSVMNWTRRRERNVARGLSLAVSTILMLALSVTANLAYGASSADSARGAQAWAQTCAHCHSLRDPTEFRDDQWRVIVTHMRARAGLSGRDARDILSFLQQSNSRVASSAPTVRTVATTSQLNSSPASDGKNGAAIYQQTCIACHGPNGKGAVPGAPDFTKSNGVLSQSHDVLMQHVINGFKSSGSPIAMPAKGGNAALTEADIVQVLNYIRGTFQR